MTNLETQKQINNVMFASFDSGRAYVLYLLLMIIGVSLYFVYALSFNVVVYLVLMLQASFAVGIFVDNWAHGIIISIVKNNKDEAEREKLVRKAFLEGHSYLYQNLKDYLLLYSAPKNSSSYLFIIIVKYLNLLCYFTVSLYIKSKIILQNPAPFILSVLFFSYPYTYYFFIPINIPNISIALYRFVYSTYYFI